MIAMGVFDEGLCHGYGTVRSLSFPGTGGIGGDLRKMFELRTEKEILDAIRSGESTGHPRCHRRVRGIARRLKVGTTRITAVKHGSALDDVRGRQARAIIDHVSAFVETNPLANARISDQRMTTIANSEITAHHDRTALCRTDSKT
jgi:hypothetical protein